MLFAALCVACFFAAFALDAIEAYYVRSVGDGAGHRAAIYSVLMYIIGCIGFFSVLSYSWWLMLPELGGLYCGSVYAIRRQARVQANPGV